MNILLKLLFTLLLAFGLPLPTIASAFSPGPMSLGCDGQNQAKIAYDGASFSAFDYDSASVLTANENDDRTVGTGRFFCNFAEFLAAKGGENLVYRSLNAAGDVNYVGITGNLERRAAEQLAEKGITIQPIPGLQNLSRADARAVEQVLIETHGLGGNGGTLLNKINSISPNNPIYQQSIQRGNELLRQAGHPGF